MAAEANQERWATLVCPVCFDFGFTGSSFRGEIGSHGTPQSPASISAGGSDPGGPATQTAALSAPAQEPDIGEPPEGGPLAQKPSPAILGRDRPDPDEKDPSGNPFVVSGPMANADDGRLETFYSLSVDMQTVEPDVKSILAGQREPETEEDFLTAFPRSQLLKNNMIPFKYWLEQPCPARRGDADPPCTAIRRGLHQHLLTTSEAYGKSQEFLQQYGYVEEGSWELSFRVGYPDLRPKDDANKSAGEMAGGWSAEGFLTYGERRVANLPTSPLTRCQIFPRHGASPGIRTTAGSRGSGR
jgi:hypothetical protein